MVDVGSLHGKVAWRIKGVALFLWRFVGCFTHCQEVWEGNQTQMVILGGVTTSASLSPEPHTGADQYWSYPPLPSVLQGSQSGH